MTEYYPLRGAVQRFRSHSGPVPETLFPARSQSEWKLEKQPGCPSQEVMITLDDDYIER